MKKSKPFEDKLLEKMLRNNLNRKEEFSKRLLSLEKEFKELQTDTHLGWLESPHCLAWFESVNRFAQDFPEFTG